MQVLELRLRCWFIVSQERHIEADVVQVKQVLLQIKQVLDPLTIVSKYPLTQSHVLADTFSCRWLTTVSQDVQLAEVSEHVRHVALQARQTVGLFTAVS